MGDAGLIDRRAALAAATSGDLDLLVIGGGITGGGTALDAATRGLSVALVEARDLASGTSSASSKLFHGGLRYLETGPVRPPLIASCPPRGSTSSSRGSASRSRPPPQGGWLIGRLRL